jgi:hypothetical protein
MKKNRSKKSRDAVPSNILSFADEEKKEFLGHRCHCITVDSAMSASQNGVCRTPQKCHIILIHNCSLIADESNR